MAAASGDNVRVTFSNGAQATVEADDTQISAADLKVDGLLYDGSATGVGIAKVEVQAGKTGEYVAIPESDTPLASGSAYYTVSGTANRVDGAYTVSIKDNGSNLTKDGYVKYTVNANSAANTNWGGFTVVPNAKKDADGEYYFNATGEPANFKVSEVRDLNGGKVSPSDYRVVYYTDADGNGVLDGSELASASEKAPSAENTGTQQYLMAVWPAGELVAGAYAGVTEPVVVPFKIGPAAAQDSASLYEVDAEYLDRTSDTTFTYVGKDYLANSSNKLTNLGLAVDGKAVDLKIAASDSSVSIATNDYYIKTIDGKAVAQDTSGLNKLVVNAGTYAIGIAKYVSGNASADTNPVLFNLTLTIAPFDLTGAKVTADDKAVAAGTVAPTLNVTNGSDTLTATAAAALAVKNTSFTAAKGVTQPVGTPSDWKLKGEYGLSVAPAVDADGKADPNFTGSATSTVKVFGSVDSGFTYNSQSFAYYESTPLVFDKSEGESFDVSALSSSGKLTTPAAKYFDVVFYDADGKVVSSPDAAGAYTAVVSVKSDLAYAKGGSDTLAFRVAESTEANVYFTVAGQPAARSISVPYTGSEVSVDVAVKADGEVVPASEYSVAVTNKATGEAVKSIVEPGTYLAKVTSDKYGLSEELTITVTNATYEGYEVVEGSFGWDPEDYKEGTLTYQEGVPYTGSQAGVELRFYNTVNGKKVYTELPAEYYSLSFTKGGKAIDAEDVVEAGDYDVTAQITQAGTDANITSLGSGPAEFSVVDEMLVLDGSGTGTEKLSDVHASEWFADSVAKATGLGYVQGVGGTSALFMPNADITRADVAMIVFRMAGGVDDDTDKTFPTQFEDVPADAYFAQAIEWAAKAGVVNGTSESTFDPYAKVTRQDLATMLYRAFGAGAQADASALDAFSDEGEVAGYAQAAMAWAVSEGVVNGVSETELSPLSQATRAQVATMAVRVAPAEEKQA